MESETFRANFTCSSTGLPCMASTFVFTIFLADSRVGAVIEIHQSDVVVIVQTVPDLS